MSGERILVVSEQLLRADAGIPPVLARILASVPGAEVLRAADVPAGTRAALITAARAKHSAREYDAVICHGFSLAYALASDESFAGRLVPFVYDAPGEDKLPFPGVRTKLGEIAQGSRFLLAADEDERSLLEAFVPASAGKVRIAGAAVFDDAGPATASAAPVAPAAPGAVARRVLLAGHDLKFTGELANHLQGHPGYTLSIDQWTSLHAHDEAASRRALADADTVICEWAGGNAVWYSQQVRPDQQLIIRLHGFEVRGDWLQDIKMDAVDTVVLVSEFFREQVLAATGWPREKTLVIPNMVDAKDFLRPKESGAEFRLGLAGMVPWFKRPDRALDILEALLEHDDRYSLHIRSRYPWEYDWFWNGRVGEQEAYREFFARLQADPRLRSRVAFEQFGPDMASWFRRIGFCLSPSHRETFHVAPLEGAASGAVPVLLDRPGAADIFDSRWVFQDPAAAAGFIHATATDPQALARESAAALDLAKTYDAAAVLPRWTNLLEAGRA
ncbi:glycosyltransferase family 4 protein [Arthrobacter gengyunqii]|uniref:Glycosyltransferase family 4 protein n=1 Tax=Arthrobacter gengyunqii TaxID=2886940 RepID=A0A9X1LY22_9MICC|nr:glycosyltransferase family 4 protein [Arthrobacter gengyunqii]MCC3267753.1 glycosyltransferase family 4 protein [Arthrobacter gengyunqii]UOY95186.1 glycosyltransferase family 4 protein [Arthrobacter gengyunqii]